MPVRIIGQDVLERNIKKMANARQVFDSDLAKAARDSVRDLVTTTPRKTGATARAWSTPKKNGLSSYSVENDEKTTDKKRLIVRILDDGRPVVRPKKSDGYLYIPLTNKGASKPLGGKIPKSLVRGVDYILAKESAAVAPTRFMSKSLAKTSRDLTRALISTIRATHGG